MALLTKQLSIKANMLWNSAGSLINMVCQWAITVLIVRLSDTYDAAGVYSLAMSVYTTFSQVAQYRTYTVQISDVRGEYTPGEYLGFRALTGVGTFVLVIGYSLVTCRMSAIPTILLYFIYRLSGLLIDVLHASDQLSHRMDYIGKSLMLQGLLSVGTFTACFSLSGSLELTLGLMTGATLLIGALYDYPRTSSLVSIEVGIKWPRARNLLIRCAPIVIAGIAASASPSIPRQYLSYSLGDSALGAYASVAAPVAIIQMGASYIYNPLLSYLSASYVEKDHDKFHRLLATTFVGIIAVGIVCAIGLELFGAPLLSLVYGESILPHIYLLQPLVLCAVITGMTWFLNDLLIALRNFKATLAGSLLGLGVSLLVMVPAQAVFELNGVTVTNIASGLVSSLFMLICLGGSVRAWFGGKPSKLEG